MNTYRTGVRQLVRIAAAVGAFGCVASAQAAPLYSNGNLVNGSGLSVLTDPDITLGVSASIFSGNRVADDFQVPIGQTWRVGSLSLFAYQTGALGFTFTTADWQILSGDLNSPTVVASGSTAVTDEGQVGYRVQDIAPANTQRPIYQIGVDIPDIDLATGSYWLVWAIDGLLASGPFVPPVSLGAGGNAEQSVGAGAFARFADGATGSNVELPFQLNAPAATTVPEPTSLALVLLAAGAAAAAARRRSA